MDGPEGALGRQGVTRREAEVLSALAERLSNAEIAARLCLSERTVESHVSSLLHKLGARNRLDLVRRSGFGTPPSTADPGRLPYQLDAIAQTGECVGRDEELRRLLACWERSATGTTVAVVRGEAGIGKSRLAAAVAANIHRRGGRVRLGTCLDGPQRPYEPFINAIADDLARRPDEELPGLLDTWGAGLARVSPELAGRLAVADVDVIDPERERAVVQAALHQFLSHAARERRLLFVIEDLHWASTATTDAVAHIARVGGEAPLMLLITTRDDGMVAGSGVGQFLGRVAGLPAVEVVALDGVDAVAAASLIAAVGGDVDPQHAVWQTGGNPLYLRELARDGQGSRSLGELVGIRFERFSLPDLDVLDLAAVAGEQVEVALVAAALDRSVDDVLDVLERAEAAGVIGTGDRPGRFAFAHDVFRSVRYASLSSSRRMRLHAAVARALGRRPNEGRELAERARHACLAGQRFDPSVAAELARRAGDEASDATDHGAAAAHYRHAATALDLVPEADEGLRLEVRIRLGAALILSGDSDGRTILEVAAQTARRRGDPVAVAEAVCAMVLVPGGSTTNVKPDPVFRTLAELALDTLPPSEVAWRIRVQAALGMQLVLTDAPARGDAMVRDAVAAARRLGDPVALGRALLSFRFCGGPTQLEERMACGVELAELGDRIGSELFSYVGCQQLCWCYQELGDREQTARWYAAAAARMRVPDIEQLSQPPTEAILDGDLQQAEELTDALDESWESTGVARSYTEALHFVIESLRGRIPDPVVLEHLVAGGGVLEDLWRALLAWSSARTGREARARELLDRERVLGFSVAFAAQGGAEPACAWAEAAVLVEDTASATELRTVLEPLAGRFLYVGAPVWDTIDRHRALLRLATGDAAEAAEIAAAAVAESRRRRTPIFLARELVVLACAQQRLGVDETDDLLEEAFAIARRTRARLIEQDARLFLAVPAGTLTPPDQFGLTRREREVVDLVASGATNAQVAATLGIAPATVRKHLEHAYEKLDVSTRTAAVARTVDRPLGTSANRSDPNDRSS